jgi:hypothetical protein
MLSKFASSSSQAIVFPNPNCVAFFARQRDGRFGRYLFAFSHKQLLLKFLNLLCGMNCERGHREKSRRSKCPSCESNVVIFAHLAKKRRNAKARE